MNGIVELYAKHIRLGKRTLDSVPLKFREQVKELLENEDSNTERENKS